MMNKYKKAKEYIDYILAHPYWGIVDIEWDAIYEIKELLDRVDEIDRGDNND